MSGLGQAQEEEGTKILNRLVDFYRNIVHTDQYSVAEHTWSIVRDSLESKKEKYSQDKFSQFSSDIDLLLLASETISSLHKN